jgi:hypothetical protein
MLLLKTRLFNPRSSRWTRPLREPLGRAAVATKKDQKKCKDETETRCPKCAARLVIRRVSNAAVDPDGREGYFIQCRECGTWLTGMTDPGGEAFLLL